MVAAFAFSWQSPGVDGPSPADPGERVSDPAQEALAYRHAIMARLEAQRSHPDRAWYKGWQGTGATNAAGACWRSMRSPGRGARRGDVRGHGDGTRTGRFACLCHSRRIERNTTDEDCVEGSYRGLSMQTQKREELVGRVTLAREGDHSLRPELGLEWTENRIASGLDYAEVTGWG